MEKKQIKVRSTSLGPETNIPENAKQLIWLLIKRVAGDGSIQITNKQLENIPNDYVVIRGEDPLSGSTYFTATTKGEMNNESNSKKTTTERSTPNQRDGGRLRAATDNGQQNRISTPSTRQKNLYGYKRNG